MNEMQTMRLRQRNPYKLNLICEHHRKISFNSQSVPRTKGQEVDDTPDNTGNHNSNHNNGTTINENRQFRGEPLGSFV